MFMQKLGLHHFFLFFSYPLGTEKREQSNPHFKKVHSISHFTFLLLSYLHYTARLRLTLGGLHTRLHYLSF